MAVVPPPKITSASAGPAGVPTLTTPFHLPEPSKRTWEGPVEFTVAEVSKSVPLKRATT